MPIRPTPHTYRCTQCGWSKTVAPRSDVLMSGDLYSHCPSCNHASLTVAPANAVSSALAAGAQALERLWRR